MDSQLQLAGNPPPDHNRFIKTGECSRNLVQNERGRHQRRPLFYCLGAARSALCLQIASFLQVFFAIDLAARIALLKHVETAWGRRGRMPP